MYPRDKWKAKGWDFMDSMDPNREWDGFAYADVDDPEQGEEGYPRLLVGALRRGGGGGGGERELHQHK